MPFIDALQVADSKVAAPDYIQLRFPNRREIPSPFLVEAIDLKSKDVVLQPRPTRAMAAWLFFHRYLYVAGTNGIYCRRT